MTRFLRVRCLSCSGCSSGSDGVWRTLRTADASLPRQVCDLADATWPRPRGDLVRATWASRWLPRKSGAEATDARKATVHEFVRGGGWRRDRQPCPVLVGRGLRRVGDGVFPWATLVANVSGSFLIGLIAALTGPDGRLLVAPELRLFLMVGICGGYTTFSSFSLQTLTLAQGGEWARPGSMCYRLWCCVWLLYARLHGRRPFQPARGVTTVNLPEDAQLLRIFFGEQ